MQVLEAQQTRVHHMPGLLAPAEVAAILALAQEVQTTDPEATLTFSDTVQLSQRGNWQTIYLHSGGAFQRKLPEIEEKLRAAVATADAAQGWSLMGRRHTARSRSGEVVHVPVSVRTAEMHRVEAGGSLPEPKHYDAGSLITIDVMLSTPGDFDGGVFRTLESNALDAEE